uniref:3-oxoacyl-[acyl-carrier-protein] synthase n=1 Tax=Brachionus koreanus TaxID=1199090 RepID=A0A291LM97_9BILA|nr:KAS [Brachionus koreanus]
MNRHRVVVTGIGLLTPLGFNINENWTNLVNGKSAIKPLVSEEYQNFPSRIAGQIDRNVLAEYLLAKSVIKKSDLKSMSWANIFALAVADEAIKDSDWKPGDENQRAGTSIGTGMSGMLETSEAAISLYNKKNYKTISPYFVPKILPNLSSGLISIKYKLKGPNHCVTTACAAGTHAIADAFNFIRNGLVDVMVCGATEACIHPVSIAGFSVMRALASKFNDRPEEASRPFDTLRDGFVMSEGAGCLILENLEHAKMRKAKIYAEILGSGLNADANHITNPSPNGNGAFKCMTQALEDSKVKPEDINYINCHATSTPAGDIAEISAIKRIFEAKNLNHQVYISSMKGSLGHLLGAAGAVEVILTVLACKNKILPINLNLDNVDPVMQMDQMPQLKLIQNKNIYLSNKKIIALKNSFGFGGTNSSICLTSFD